MKKMYLLTMFFYLICQNSIAQPIYSHVARTQKVISPKFVDGNQFKKDLLEKVDLQSIFNQLKRDTLVGFYKYFFRIKPDGIIEPYRYFNDNQPDMAKLQYFVKSFFNNYKWLPGYKRNCKRCKIKSYLELIVSFESDENQIDVSIYEIAIRSEKTLFDLHIPYSALNHKN